MGSIFARGQRLYIRFKSFNGEWTQAATKHVVGEEREALAVLARTEDKIAAVGKHADPLTGRVSVARYFGTWIKRRERLVPRSWKDDESRFRNHILPVLGDLEIDKVRPRHVIDLIDELRLGGKLGHKTIQNVYGALRAFFRDARNADLVSGDGPCSLTRHELGTAVERDTDEAAASIYPREDVRALLFCADVPLDRRVFYALEYFGRCRLGEAAALCWRHYDPARAPLGQLRIARSHDRDTTKSGRTRCMPVHPTLAAILADWRATWPTVYGREPTPDDLIVGAVKLPGKGRRLETGAQRTKNSVAKQFRKDLAAAGLPHRRGHDLGASFITHAEEDGADRERLNKCTHTGGRRGLGAFEKYLRQNWTTLCGEVAKLQVTIAGNPAQSREAAGDVCCNLAAHPKNPEERRMLTEWRRRESKTVSWPGASAQEHPEGQVSGASEGPSAKVATRERVACSNAAKRLRRGGIGGRERPLLVAARGRG